jgi:hypothetical protein
MTTIPEPPTGTADSTSSLILRFDDSINDSADVNPNGSPGQQRRWEDQADQGTPTGPILAPTPVSFWGVLDVNLAGCG